jgi:hypothetical protein
MICDECETVAHCLKNGCGPKQPALKPLKDEQIVETFCKAPHQTQYVAWFAAGVRYAEAHHGITEKGGAA